MARACNAIEERPWQTREDLAEVYLVWGGYAYGTHSEGTPARAQFAERLEQMQAVLDNQDKHLSEIGDKGHCPQTRIRFSGIACHLNMLSIQIAFRHSMLN